MTTVWHTDAGRGGVHAIRSAEPCDKVLERVGREGGCEDGSPEPSKEAT